MNTIKYRPLTPLDSLSVQKYTLEDLRDGRVDNAESIANPYNLKLIANQALKIHSNPDIYTGAVMNHRLQGYMKLGKWGGDLELDFSTAAEKEAIRNLKEAGLSSPRRKLAILGLVTSKNIHPSVQDEITGSFFDIADKKGEEAGLIASNIVIYENDRVIPVAEDHGYEFTGRTGMVNNLRGPVQMLYSKPLQASDSSDSSVS